MRDRLRLAWSGPPATHPLGPAKRDWVLVGLLLASALLEVAARPGLSWTGASTIVAIATLPSLLWRRSRPASMAALGFGAMAALSLARLATGSELPELHTSAFLLLLPYSLFRWGSERAVRVGTLIILVSTLLGVVSNRLGVGDFIGGFAVVLSAMALGAAARYRARLRSQEFEQVKLRERERLARELHDTVAHHVSAIAIRAQAGLALSATQHEAPIDALHIIQAEASRCLAEMQAIVRSLRQGESVDLAPSPRITDLERLADRSDGGPVIDVDVSGDLDDLSPSLSAAIYRLAQESVTNARRHARQATRIEVGVTADQASVRLRVSDDGELTHARPATAGYGLTGMMERAVLLGGTCSAGPGPERGWTVTAELPRRGRTP